MSDYIQVEITAVIYAIGVKMRTLRDLIEQIENAQNSDEIYEGFVNNMKTRECCEGYFLPELTSLDLPSPV